MENKVDILGVGIDCVTMRQSVMQVMDFVTHKGTYYVVTPNSEMIENARKDGKLKAALNGADLAIPDGVGILYASKLLNTPLPEKVPGCELCEHVIGELDKIKGSLFLFGGAPSIAEKAAQNIKKAYPNLIIAGTHDGYYEDDRPIVEQIIKAAPDVIFVCLGSPKQEKWMAQHKNVLSDIVMIGAGGTMDILAGSATRAPEFYIKHGLEWLYRFTQEPQRIGRLMKLPLFGFLVIKRRILGK